MIEQPFEPGAVLRVDLDGQWHSYARMLARRSKIAFFDRRVGEPVTDMAAIVGTEVLFVLDVHETAYETVPTSALTEADAAWLVSSVRLAAPIIELDGVALAQDAELTASFNQYLLSPRE